MLVVPIQPVPSQQVQCVLAGQNCQIAIYAKRQGLFVDLNCNGLDVSVASLVLNTVFLTHNYSGFVGNLLFVDTQGSSNPTATGLGSRFQLVYLTTAETRLAIRPVPAAPRVLRTGFTIAVNGVTVGTGGTLAVNGTVVSTGGSLSVDGGI